MVKNKMKEMGREKKEEEKPRGILTGELILHSRRGLEVGKEILMETTAMKLPVRSAGIENKELTKQKQVIMLTLAI